MDALGERMLNMVDLDPSPFPDFRSMRLALQHGCDVATHEEMLNDQLRQYSGAITAVQEAGIGFAEREIGQAHNGDIPLQHLQDIIDLHRELAFHAIGGPPVRFVKLPYPGGKLTWNASLIDFVNLVVATEAYGIAPKDMEDSLELIAERYRSIIEVDYAGYTDFQALRSVYPVKINYKIYTEKLFRMDKAHRILFDAGQLIAYKHFPGFAVQSDYHTILAEEVVKLWPQIDLIKIMYLFDVLFMPTKHLKAVLKSRD